MHAHLKLDHMFIPYLFVPVVILLIAIFTNYTIIVLDNDKFTLLLHNHGMAVDSLSLMSADVHMFNALASS